MGLSYSPIGVRQVSIRDGFADEIVFIRASCREPFP